MVVEGQLRMECIRDEAQELGRIYAKSKTLSFFNLYERSRYSLQATRLILVMMQKTLAFKAKNQKEDQEGGRTMDDQSAMTMKNADLIADERFSVFLSQLIHGLEKCDQSAEWVGSWFSPRSFFK
jgi:hypothetical protein